MSIYINRILNMKHIKAIGLDMDHTLVRYHSDVFEELTFHKTLHKLLHDKEYPEEIKHFSFDYKKAIRGLIIDKENGNLLKVSLYNKIKASYHGTKKLSYREQKSIYRGSSVDVSDSTYISVDTAFSIAFTVIFAQLVDLKDSRPDLELPSYAEMAQNTLYSVDMAHRDGSLKREVQKDLQKFIQLDPEAVQVLERFKKYGKRIWIITNSDYAYTKLLLDHTVTPFLKEHKSWEELFEITITLSAKPSFFNDGRPFLKVDPQTGMMENFDEKLLPGIYQGGNAQKLEKDMGLKGDEILYLGDHIYGDILKLKKSVDWRTALILEELDHEVEAYKLTKDISKNIDELMAQKIAIEKKLDELYSQEIENGKEVSKSEINSFFDLIEDIDKQLGKLIKEYEQHFNPYWGEILHAGAEPSFYASQIDRYACVYMCKLSDFRNYNPRTYFRPKKRKLSHEL